MEEGECPTDAEQQSKEPFNPCAAVEKRGNPGYCNRLGREMWECPNGGVSSVSDGALQTTSCRCSKKHASNVKRRKCQVSILAAIAVFMFIIATTLAILLAVEKSKRPLACAVPCCPDNWVGYRGKCYYFSETEGNWTYSRSQCSVLNASLVGIDSPQEKNFLLRYKGFLDYWIGLQSAPGQPWRLSNSTELDQRSSIKGGGDCAYVYENQVSSSRCSTKRHWICSKSDAQGRT